MDKMCFEENSRMVPRNLFRPAPADAACLGASMAAACSGELLVAHSGTRGAAALAKSFAAGCASAGANVTFVGECSAAAASYAVKSLGLGAGCHIHTEITPVFKMFGCDGLCLFADTEDDISARFDSGGGECLPYSHYGRINAVSCAGEIYSGSLRSRLGGGLRGIFADVCSPSPAVAAEAIRALDGKNDASGERIAFHLSSDGEKISAYSEKTGYVFGEKLLMLRCKGIFENGGDVAFCGRPPRWLSQMAAKYGSRVVSCGRNVCAGCRRPSDQCRSARRLAAAQSFTHDCCALMFDILEILRRENISLSEAIDGLPDTAGVSKFIPVDRPSELLYRLCVNAANEPDGIISDEPSGLVTVRPVRTGKGLMLSVESYSYETAAELCRHYAQLIEKS